MILLRSALFAVSLLITTPLFSIVALLTFPFSIHLRYRVIMQWSRLTLWLLKLLCGLGFEVKGAENISRDPSIVISKHQSAWETLAFQLIFPPQVWVLKKSLLYIPFLGWGLAMLKPIAIDRQSSRHALKQVLKEGKKRLEAGFSVVIFPEGTRMTPGQRGKYNAGGAWLALHADKKIIPVAHNAGQFWGRKAFLKSPGCITVSIGPAIAPTDKRPNELMRCAETWIEDEMLRLQNPAGPVALNPTRR